MEILKSQMRINQFTSKAYQPLNMALTDIIFFLLSPRRNED